jgi:hypothetical protein
LHATATAVPTLTTLEIEGKVVLVKRQSDGQALYDDGKAGAVGLTCG